jgi:hypothetical protein
MGSAAAPIDPAGLEAPALDEQAPAADDIVQECGLASFPASDPPSWPGK